MITRLRRLKTLAIVAGLIFAGAMCSCDDEPGQVGKDLIQQGETVTLGEDSKFTSKSFTYTDDVIRTDNKGNKTLLLGSYNDTIYGRVTASFAAQFRLQYKPDFGEEPKADSIFLKMFYKRFYGDTTKNDQLKLKIYELTTDLNPDTKYDSNTDLSTFIGDKPILEHTLQASIDTSKSTTGTIDTSLVTLSIKLGKDFAKRLMNVPAEDVVDNDKFLKNFKGLYFEIEERTTDGGALIRAKDDFRSTSSSPAKYYNPYLELYYHNNKDTVKAAKDAFPYAITNNSAIVSMFKHDYTQVERFNKFLNKDVQDTVIFIQPTGGLRSKILIDDLDNWKGKSDFKIDKASITFYVDTTLTGYSKKAGVNSRALPGLLKLEYIDESGNAKPLADSERSSAYTGGTYTMHSNDAGKLDRIEYEFRITHHLQKIINGEIKNQGFYLSNPSPAYSYNGVVLKGAESSRGIKVKVLYSKIE